MGLHLCLRLNLGGLTAVLMWALITAISTIICSIAQLPLANTTPIPTQELVWSTLRGACKRRREKKHITAYWWNNSHGEEKIQNIFYDLLQTFYMSTNLWLPLPLNSAHPAFLTALHIFMLIWRSTNSLPVWVHYCFTVKFIWLVSLRTTGRSWLSSLCGSRIHNSTQHVQRRSQFLTLIIWSVTPAQLWILSLPRKEHLV